MNKLQRIALTLLLVIGTVCIGSQLYRWGERTGRSQVSYKQGFQDCQEQF